MKKKVEKQDVVKEVKPEVVVPAIQGIKEFSHEFIKAKGSGLSVQGKASRRIKGLTVALQTRKWEQDSKNPLQFTIIKKDREFKVVMDQDGKTAVLTTLGKVVQFPLGKGAFRSVDYVLAAYGHKYVSSETRYEEIASVV